MRKRKTRDSPCFATEREQHSPIPRSTIRLPRRIQIPPHPRIDSLSVTSLRFAKKFSRRGGCLLYSHSMLKGIDLSSGQNPTGLRGATPSRFLKHWVPAEKFPLKSGASQLVSFCQLHIHHAFGYLDLEPSAAPPPKDSGSAANREFISISIQEGKVRCVGKDRQEIEFRAAVVPPGGAAHLPVRVQPPGRAGGRPHRGRRPGGARPRGGEPRPFGVQKLGGIGGYRIRIGNYRVLYEVNDKRLLVSVYRIKHCREASR